MSNEAAVLETPETPVLEANEVTQTGIEAPTAEVEVAPVVEPVTPTAPVEAPEQRYEYQPTDEQGRTLGGVQVIKYRTQEELVQKLSDQNVLILRKLREQRRRNEFGINDSEPVPAEAPRLNVVDFSPRQLTADERVKLSRDLLDPDKFEDATSMLFEATVGQKPEVLRNTLSELQTTRIEEQAVKESIKFIRANPDFYECMDNGKIIANWVAQRGLAPVQENFQRAYDSLKDKSILVSAPITPATPATPVVSEPVPAVTPAVEAPAPPVTPVIEAQKPAAPVVAPISTGLTRSQASSEGPVLPAGSDIEYTLAGVKYTGLKAVDMMPSDEFRKRVREDKNFEKRYAQLLQAKTRGEATRRPV